MNNETEEARYARKREQDRLRQRRRRAKANPLLNGPLRIAITIQDPDLWRRACHAGERESLTAITERVIDEECRAYKKHEIEAMWVKLSKIRTGLMDRLAAGATVDVDGNWMISEKRDDPPPKPMKKPDDWTEEEWEAAIAEWSEESDEWEASRKDWNPETGKSKWVNTKHNWERDR